MSIYYILVNQDKKEWIDSGDLGLGLKSYVYKTCITSLLGFLVMDEYGVHDEKQYNPTKHIIELDEKDDSNFSFLGHWNGDTHIQLVSEYDELYEICHGYEDYEDESKDWVNISIPLAKEWNYSIKYWYGDSPDMKEWVKHHLYNR